MTSRSGNDTSTNPMAKSTDEPTNTTGMSTSSTDTSTNTPTNTPNSTSESPHPIPLAPRGWAPARGYSNGMAARGTQIFIAGQIGWNPTTGQFDRTDFVSQVEQALRNVVDVLHAAGAGPQHLVRLTWFITDKAAYMAAQREIGVAYRSVIGRHFPAMSVVVVSALIEDAAQVEIEATAVIPE